MTVFNTEPNFDNVPDECLSFVCDTCGNDLDNDSSICYESDCTGSAKTVVNMNSWLVSIGD